ncbi:hypothetical protein M3Y95_01291500 [Aphelenchoides besseyi]|nr:hypothetical protein M3Y95_01291500 [Aphelenchoides besseyi]
MNSTGDSVGFDRYFYANVTDESFYETPFGIFCRANILLASSLGLIVTCLLFYMIRYKSPTSFRPYSKLLYLCLALDLYCLLFFLVSQPRFKITPSLGITVYSGVVCLLNQRGQCYFNYVGALVPVMQSLILPVFAFYRHHHIKNKMAPSTKKLVMYSFIALIPVIIGLIIPTFSKCVTQEITTDVILSWKAETPLPEVLVVYDYKNDRYVSIGSMYRKIVCYCSFALAICISVASIRLLRREWPKLNKKAKTAMLTFTKVLIIQSLLPLMSVIFPMFLLIVLMFVKTSSDVIDSVVVICLTWSTTLNVICNLFIIAPYRRELFRILSRCCPLKQTNPTTSIVFVSSSRVN